MAKVFNKYEVIHKIGSGGMSSVFLGKHIVLEKRVAIKTLNPGLALDKQYIERFEHEAKATAALSCNNIISVIDFGNVEDDYFIVMEYVEGRDLRHLQKALHDKAGSKIGFPIEVALAILLEVAYGLKKAHERGVVHRDIKPSNVLLSIDGEVKIVDFGLALSLGTLERLAKTRFTQTGKVIGTPSSMSPEQAAGR
ncbi:MAG: serine/threonine-protein kinase, partial [bacterium]